MKSDSANSFNSKERKHKIEKFLVRLEFFASTEEYAPEILEFLKNKALPAYNQLLKKDILMDKTNRNRFHYLDWDYIKHANRDYFSDLVPLKEVLNEWSDKYNLSDDWIIESAVNTLNAWSLEIPLDDELYWADVKHIMYPSPFPRKCHRLNFNHSGWDPVRYTWKQAKKIIMNDFKHFLEGEYYKKVSRLVEKAGIKPPIVKRQSQRHINWLIAYQIYNKSYTDICNEESDNRPDDKSLDNSTIIKGIKSTAKLIGLTLRK